MKGLIIISNIIFLFSNILIKALLGLTLGLVLPAYLSAGEEK